MPSNRNIGWPDTVPDYQKRIWSGIKKVNQKIHAMSAYIYMKTPLHLRVTKKVRSPHVS